LDRVTADGLFDYVYNHVHQATSRKQSPESRGNFQNTDEIADLTLPGTGLNDVAVDPDRCLWSRGAAPSPKRDKIEPAPPSDAFQQAISRGILLPGQPGSAFDMLADMRDKLDPAGYLVAENRLLNGLEAAGQQIILEYLKGEEVPLHREDFIRGEALFDAAARLLPGNALIESRRAFFHGRQLLFDNTRYHESVAALEGAIRLDPAGAYAYNALGIAFLQMAEYGRAENAFRDAIRFAPYWAYARHNLALALIQSGAYTEAIHAYRDGMNLRPAYAYIPYNLGLLLERLNRPQEARAAWGEALARSPGMARAWTAIGLSWFLEHRYAEAERDYRRAFTLATATADRVAARHDLALLLVARHETGDAIKLWRQSLAEKPDDLPTLIGLTDTLASTGETAAALTTVDRVVQLKPSYAGAHVQYARLLLGASRPEDAVRQLEAANLIAPGKPDTMELLGDALLQSRSGMERATRLRVLALYRQAIASTSSRSEKNRIQRKIAYILRPKNDD
jgi:tetratricopeptide (TPR) repeat protein